MLVKGPQQSLEGDMPHFVAKSSHSGHTCVLYFATRVSASISRSHIDFVHMLWLGQFPCQRMFPSSATNHQHWSSHHAVTKTRQIWGIWKLRPAYSPETPNLGQNRWCFVPCDLEIWWMTLQNNRAPLLCCFKLCATFHSHRWIQTGVADRKRPIWVKFDDF